MRNADTVRVGTLVVQVYEYSLPIAKILSLMQPHSMMPNDGRDS